MSFHIRQWRRTIWIARASGIKRVTKSVCYTWNNVAFWMGIWDNFTGSWWNNLHCLRNFVHKKQLSFAKASHTLRQYSKSRWMEVTNLPLKVKRGFQSIERDPWNICRYNNFFYFFILCKNVGPWVCDIARCQAPQNSSWSYACKGTKKKSGIKAEHFAICYAKWFPPNLLK